MSDVEAPPKPKWSLDIGASYLGSGITKFRLFAPYHAALSLELDGKTYPMQQEEYGYFSLQLDKTTPGSCYSYLLPDGRKLPDPVSRALPKGVHGATEIIDPQAYQWGDQEWSGIELADAIIYEIHVGTFTADGTFEAVIDKLDYLLDLGITMIEIMPIADFPGRWNWGYDGVSLFAPAHTYGGVAGFKRLIDAAHKKGMAVCLDVVYNHLGPEGNYLGEFGPYFSCTYKTPWGETFNFDGKYADGVRHYIKANAHYWAEEYHIDALRLDAIHGIYDCSAQQILPQLADELSIPLIAESNLNDARHIQPREMGGAHLGAIWNDDFHHAAHVALTGERDTYYIDYDGCADLAKTVQEGFAYNGRFSHFKQQTFGNSPRGIPYEKFVVFTQNHDQAGNRAYGERLTTLTDPKKCEAAAFLTLMSPFTPMLFMGEEYGETAPFEYFVDFSDPELMKRISEGRKYEFCNPRMPYPGEEAFANSQLSWKMDVKRLSLYKKLIALRKAYAPKEGLVVGEIESYSGPEWVAWEYPTIQGVWIGLFVHLGGEQHFTLPFQHVRQEKIVLATEEIELQAPLPLPGIFSLLVI